MNNLKKIAGLFLAALFFFNVAGVFPLYQFSIEKIRQANQEQISNNLNNNLSFIQVSLFQKTLAFKPESPIQNNDQLFALVSQKADFINILLPYTISDENIHLLNNLIDIQLNIDNSKKTQQTTNSLINFNIGKHYTSEVSKALMPSLFFNLVKNNCNFHYLFSLSEFSNKIDLPPPEHPFF